MRCGYRSSSGKAWAYSSFLAVFVSVPKCVSHECNDHCPPDHLHGTSSNHSRLARTVPMELTGIMVLDRDRDYGLSGSQIDQISSIYTLQIEDMLIYSWFLLVTNDVCFTQGSVFVSPNHQQKTTSFFRSPSRPNSFTNISTNDSSSLRLIAPFLVDDVLHLYS